MRDSEEWKRKGFVRWAKQGPNGMDAVMLRAASAFLQALEAASFRWVDKAFDSSGVPAHVVNLERNLTAARTDYVMVIFDKHRRPRFQVLFGSKGSTSPYPWIRAGALVWEQGSELVKFKWWGPSWWQLNKVESLSRTIDKVASLMPQVLQYMSSGEVGANVHSEIVPQLGI